MDLYTTVTVAEELGITPVAVRRLVGTGRLPATKIAGSLVFEPESIHRFQRGIRTAGRIWSERTAWAALELLSGTHTELIDQPRRSRLVQRLRSMDAADFHRLARNHSQAFRFHASPRAHSRLTGLLVPSGITSLSTHDIAMRFALAGNQNESRFEGYWTETVEALLKRTPMTRDETGGVLVRIVEDSEMMSRAVGSDAVIALDLMDSDDIRERGAGRNMLRKLIANV